MSSLFDYDFTDSDVESVRLKVDSLATEVQQLVIDRLMRDFTHEELIKVEDIYGSHFTYRMLPDVQWVLSQPYIEDTIH
jgi:hypothetical protein